MDYTLRLPVEVLSCIFRFARHANGVPTERYTLWARWEGEPEIQRLLKYGDRKSEEYRAFVIGWLSLTHVCCRWRALALGDTCLWTDMPTTLGVQWMYAFLDRSGDRPIFLDWRGGDSYENTAAPDVVADILRKHSWRLRNFRATIRSEEKKLQTDAIQWPELEELEVKLYSSELSAFTLLADRTPRLRHLSFSSSPLDCTTFPWHSTCMNTLVVLDIHFWDGIHGSSMVEFLDALGRMPGLRHLRLCNGTPWDEENETYPPIPRPLSFCDCCNTNSARLQRVRLESLTLKCDWSLKLHVLRHLSPPPTVRILLEPEEIHMANGDRDELHGHLRSAGAYIRRWRHARVDPQENIIKQQVYAQPYISLNIAHEYDHEMEQAGIRLLISCFPAFSTRIPEHSWYEGVDAVHSDLEILVPYLQPAPGHDGAQQAVTLIAEVLQSLGIESISMLNLCGYYCEALPDTSSAHFIGYFSHPVFDSIEILCLPELFRKDLRSLVESFGKDVSDGNSEHGDASSSDGLLPALKVLEIKHLCDLSRFYVPDLESIVADLKTILDKRRGVCVYMLAACIVDEWRDRLDSEDPDLRWQNEIRGIVKALDEMPQAKIMDHGDAVPPYASILA